MCCTVELLYRIMYCTVEGGIQTAIFSRLVFGLLEGPLFKFVLSIILLSFGSRSYRLLLEGGYC